MISFAHILGIVLTLFLIAAVSVLSGKTVKSGADFDSGGGKASAAVVAGGIMGTLVGGSSTVGTAQLAYTYGMSAWWFTLGGGIACAILALVYAKPLRRTGCTTTVGILAREFGAKTGIAASVLSSIGTFINILSQLLSATAVIAIVFPNLNLVWSLIIAAALMALYVVFGGVLGAGMVGVVKLVLLYVAVIAGGGIAVALSGGISTLYHALDHATYFNLFARGIGKDAGAGLSLILGVLSTQSYAQSLLAGKTDAAAKKGALISAFLIPPIGIGGILIGMYMRVYEPALSSPKMAFPQFVLNHMPPLLAGVVLATLLIAVIGTGAGLSLGISTVVRKDIICRFTNRFDSPRKSLTFSRVLILVILAAACALCACPIGDTILNFAFMSMGLRGTVIFVPLTLALWLPGRTDRRYIFAGIIVSPLLVLILGLLDCLCFDPLFLGVGVSALLGICGCFAGKRQTLHK